MSVHKMCPATIRWLLASSTISRCFRFSFSMLVVSCALLAPAAGQVPNYRLQRIPIVEGAGLSQTGLVNEMNNRGMVVGFHTPGGVITGFVYDHFGLIGTPGTVHSLTKWIPVQSGWTTSSCVGINNLGQVVGYFGNAQSQRIGYYLDLDLNGAGAEPTWEYLPPLSGYSYGKQINDLQDVLIFNTSTRTGTIFNRLSGTLTPLTVPTSGAPLALDSPGLSLNNLGQVVGRTSDLSVFRLTPAVQLEFPPLVGYPSINDNGLMAGTLPGTGSGKQSTPSRACLYGSQVDVLSNIQSYASDINNDGDVAGGLGGDVALYHDALDMWFLLDNLVVGSGADLGLWFHSNASIGAVSLSDRKETGFGQILAQVDVKTTTGSGKKMVTTTAQRFFVLTPELP